MCGRGARACVRVRVRVPAVDAYMLLSVCEV